MEKDIAAKLLQQIINETGVHWKKVLLSPSAKMLKRYPFLKELKDYVFSFSEKLNDSCFRYSVETRAFWVLNKLDDFPKCRECGKPIVHWNVKDTTEGYKRCCNRECSRKAAQKSIEAHMLEKYGVRNAFQLEDVVEKNKQNYDIWLKKSSETKKKHGTFTASKGEDAAYLMLKKFKFPDIIRQHKSAAYPFLCDFYVPSQDLYIEYMGSWTHGGHHYDSDSIEDQKRLEEMQKKAEHSRYYRNAIHTWTIRDPKKLQHVKNNRLSYVELWSFKEAAEYANACAYMNLSNRKGPSIVISELSEAFLQKVEFHYAIEKNKD